MNEIIKQYAESGVVGYKVDSSGDSRVCSVCKEQDGRVHKAADAEPGKNHPPFHDGCRCITLPLFDGIETPWEN